MAGATVVVSMLPVDVLFGLSALGTQDTALAIRAVLVSLVIGNAMLAWEAPRSALFGALRPTQTLLLIGLAASITRDPGLSTHRVESLMVGLVLTGICSGLLQWFAGIARLGRLLKFVSLPVVAGIVNGSAAAIALMSIRDVLAWQGAADIATWWAQGSNGFILRSMAVALVLGLMAVSVRRGWRVHWSMVGLIAGTAVYEVSTLWYADANALAQMLGGTLPKTPPLEAWPQALASLRGWGTGQQRWRLLILVLPIALSVAFVNSVDVLVTVAYFESLHGARLDSNRLMRRLGAANALIGLAGGLPFSLANGRLLIGSQTGATDWRGPVAASVTAVVLVFTLPSVVQFVPRLAACAVMLYLACSLVDAWSKRSVLALLHPRTEKAVRLALRLDVLLMLAVAVLAVTAGLAVAVSVGVAASAGLFIRNNSRSIIAATYRGNQRRSLVVRTRAQEARLDQKRSKILLIELQGALFFGSAEAMRDAVERLISSGDILLLDLHFVSEIDASAAGSLARMARSLVRSGSSVFLSSAQRLPQTSQIQLKAALLGVLDPNCLVVDADRALQAAEDLLLDGERASDEGASAATLLTSDGLMHGFNKDEVTFVRMLLDRESHADGATIFKRGDAGDALYLVTQGEVEILMTVTNGASKRLALFRPGVMFGEMGLINGQERSADAIARGPVTLLRLGTAALERIRLERPDLAFKVVRNIARQISSRLVIANAELRYALKI